MMVQMEFLFHTTRFAHTYMPMHLHDCHELVYYHSGSGTTCLGDKRLSFVKNNYALIPPKTLHDERRLEDTEVTFVGFTLLDQHFPALQQGLLLESPAKPLIEKLLLEMNAEMAAKQEFYPYKLNLLITEILIEHFRLSDTKANNNADETLLYARKFIDENYNQKISIADLSQIAGYSYDHFRHLFKAQFGLSPIAYVLGKRLDQARSLLRSSELSVTAISMECGFSNDPQFCTIFKREFGESPLAYRRNSFQTQSSRLE